MKAKLLYSLLITFISFTITNRQYQPVIAIVAASIPEDSDDPIEAVVYPTYSKWAVNSGARVIPILPWYSHEKIDRILNKVNGVIWQGGMRNLRINGQFEALNKYILDKILAKNENRVHFPAFMICQGFELVHILLVNSTNILSNFTAMNYFSPMEVNENTNNSRLYRKFSEEDFTTLTQLNSTVHYHMYGFHPDLYKNYTILDNFFSINSNGYDRDGKKFIGSVEGKNYPIYAVQHHPEKVKYERKIPADSIVNSNEAFLMSKKLADFFVEEARKNRQQLEEKELKEFLMIDTVNTQPIFYHESWVYLFKKQPNRIKKK